MLGAEDIGEEKSGGESEHSDGGDCASGRLLRDEHLAALTVECEQGHRIGHLVH